MLLFPNHVTLHLLTTEAPVQYEEIAFIRPLEKATPLPRSDIDYEIKLAEWLNTVLNLGNFLLLSASLLLRQVWVQKAPDYHISNNCTSSCSSSSSTCW